MKTSRESPLTSVAHMGGGVLVNDWLPPSFTEGSGTSTRSAGENFPRGLKRGKKKEEEPGGVWDGSLSAWLP